METLYLEGHDFKLGRSSRHIVVRRQGQLVREIPVLDLRRILIFGNSQLSTSLLNFLAGEGVEVAFLSPSGRCRCRLVPETSKNIPLRLAQYGCCRDRGFRLRFSQTVAAAKIANQRTLLRRYRRWHSRTDLENEFAALSVLRRKAAQAGSARTLRGLEGTASRLYFSAFATLLRNGFVLPGRSYHPPRDPVNALLSFGYSLVSTELGGLLQASGLDPMLGLTHTIRYGRPSLALDLVEEFRAPFVDRLVLYLVNKRILRHDDFVASPETGVRLGDAARRRYFEVYEAFARRRFHDRRSGRKLTFRELFRESVENCVATLRGRGVYRPFIDRS